MPIENFGPVGCFEQKHVDRKRWRVGEVLQQTYRFIYIPLLHHNCWDTFIYELEKYWVGNEREIDLTV